MERDEQRREIEKEFLKLNPIGFVPVLVDGDMVLADSLAILLYLDEKYPQHQLLPTDDIRRKAINLQAANIVSSGIQPFQNLAVININKKVSSEEEVAWIKYHVGKGFAALEELLKDYAGRYATGDEVQLADLFLAPQIHSATTRFNLDMSEYPLLSGLNEAYSQLPAFQNAMPENQPDKTS